ncbi:MAG: hypothetical protein DHS20C05_11780 [Hyphococcus sp.]|nr:MAG: hypothetical protein DHS20C05_11780 [Marinicaulis sp.]
MEEVTVVIKKILIGVALIILLPGVSSCARETPSQKSTTDHAELSDKISMLVEESHDRGAFNGNIIVIKGGKTLYENSLGYTNSSRSEKLSSASIFNVGSIAKEFNAVGVMILKERGKLTLDDKVSDYIPALPEWAEQIQIRHLLNYTSGLPRVNWDTAETPDDVFNDLIKLDELEFQPGQGYLYSNNNVFLQRLIIAEITGQSFEQFTIDNMLKPSGMKHAVIDPPEGSPLVVQAFNTNLVDDPFIVYPITGWVHLTADDMVQWLTALHEGKLISASSLETVFHSYSENQLGAMGLGRFEGDVATYHQHHGSSYNYEALMTYDLAEDLMIVLLTNNKNYKVFEITEAIEAINKGEDFSIPKKSLSQALEKECLEDVQGCLETYHEMKEANYDLYDFDNEQALNNLGYAVLGEGKIKGAIEIFKLLVSEFPEGSNGYDSLGEAYFADKDYERSLENYEKSLALDPANENARKYIAEITRILNGENP